MKTILTSFLTLIIGIQFTFSQKNDYHWVLGNKSIFSHIKTDGGSDIIFSDTGITEIKYVYRDMPFWLNCMSIADTKGKLQFYSNGCYIENTLGQILPNGRNLNPGEFADEFCETGYGGVSSFVLPHPDNPKLYHLIHLAYNDDADGEKLYYTTVDMSVQGGIVREKNQIIVEDEISVSKLTAVKHANGRDWWIINPKGQRSNDYYKVLLTPNGFSEPKLQKIGSYRRTFEILGQATFTPNGDRYILIDNNNPVMLFDFDRCSGELSNPLEFYLPIGYDSLYATGVAVSPSGRFLYASAFYHIYQYDLEAADIEASVELVAVYDGFKSPFGSTFYRAQRGPDGRIYLNCTNGENVLHVINHPDRKGKACEVVQHGIQLPTYNPFLLPNHPNYRLGALEDSACDTLRKRPLPSELTEMIVAPNPTKDQVHIYLNQNHEFIDLTLVNVSGQHLLERQVPQGRNEVTIDLGDLPVGMYFITVRNEEQRVTKRVVKYE